MMSSPTCAAFWAAQALLRIHIHRDRYLAEGAVADGRPHSVANCVDGLMALLRLDDQPPAVPPPQPEERCGAEQVVAGSQAIRHEVPDRLGRRLDTGLVLAAQSDLDQVGERRIAQRAPPLD